MSDPWFKCEQAIEAGGRKLKLAVPHDVFSTQRVDEGTLLLLDHLPAPAPKRVLDLGCGYGALGLPVAARFPEARVEMVDRDLLAVEWSARNARANKLGNAEAYGSLGYRDLARGRAGVPVPYDWILCNVPARIGRPFTGHLISAGLGLLAPGGELRVVVIRDLGPIVEELRDERGWALVEAGRGPRHIVYALPRGESAPILEEPADLYLRDRVDSGGLELDRPFDLGGDDPKRLKHGIPVLLDVLPRKFAGRALCFRIGYGAVPLAALSRWPDSRVLAVDRDLLGMAFTRRNAEKLGLAGPRLEIREHAHFPDALEPGERFGLAVGEISPSAGEAVAEAELRFLASRLEAGGEALILCLEKLEREWVRAIQARTKLRVHPALSREGFTVLRLSPQA
ncbi:MAG: methyltransferase [Bdellovibrionales bacterium]|nr:methyltransferase [Bdellovibrionales bacterium]